MLTRLKRALVDTYVGAIAMGYLLAETVIHFCGIFTSPVAGWVSRGEYGKMAANHLGLPQGFLFREALPDLVRFVAFLVVWLLLMRWLYFKPAGTTPSVAEAKSEQAS